MNELNIDKTRWKKCFALRCMEHDTNTLKM